MCESNAYLLKDGNEDLLMENVDFLKSMSGTVVLRSIFGEEKTVAARIVEMNLTAHRIVLESV